MKKKILIFICLVVILITGIIVGRLTAPIKEKIVEKEVVPSVEEVEVEAHISGLAKTYLLKFISIQEDIDKLPYHEEEYQTTYGMRALASQEYDMWDTLLNEIYSEIKNILSAEEMKKLTDIQVQWIEDRDTKAEDAGKEVEGGTMQPLMIISSKVNTTRQRCLELIETYMN